MNNISNTAAGKLDAAGANLAATAAGSFQAAGSHQDPGTGVLQQIQDTGSILVEIDRQAAQQNQDHAAGADHAGAAGLSCNNPAAGTISAGQDTGSNQEPGSPAYYQEPDQPVIQEIRIYGINLDQVEDDEISILDLDDQGFQEIAEKQGLVWSLAGFEEDFNDDFLMSGNMYIRIIPKK